MRRPYCAIALFVAATACRTEPSPTPEATPASPPAIATSSTPEAVAPASQPAAAAVPAEPLGPRDLPLAWSRLPLLPRRLKPRGWKAALTTWHTATTAYARGDLQHSAERFLAVAQHLSGKQRGAAHRVRITARCLAYENAGRALQNARDDVGARALLEEAAEKDPACQNSIALRLSRIARDAPTGASTSTAAP